MLCCSSSTPFHETLEDHLPIGAFENLKEGNCPRYSYVRDSLPPSFYQHSDDEKELPAPVPPAGEKPDDDDDDYAPSSDDDDDDDAGDAAGDKRKRKPPSFLSAGAEQSAKPKAGAKSPKSPKSQKTTAKADKAADKDAIKPAKGKGSRGPRGAYKPRAHPAKPRKAPANPRPKAPLPQFDPKLAEQLANAGASLYTKEFVDSLQSQIVDLTAKLGEAHTDLLAEKTRAADELERVKAGQRTELKNEFDLGYKACESHFERANKMLMSSQAQARGSSPSDTRGASPAV